MNPSVYLPPRVRAVCYYVYAALSAVAAAVMPILTANQVPLPLWVKIATGALAALGTAFGLVAASNTPRQPPPPADTHIPEHAADSGDALAGPEEAGQ